MPATPQSKPKRHQYSHDLRVLCVQKHLSGHGYGSIGKTLKMSKSSVRNIVKYHEQHGHSELSPRQGRPRKTDERQDRRIVRAAEANRFISAATLASQVERETGKPISKSTIRNRLRETGLHGRSARKKPYLSPKHRKKRLQYARKYKAMTADEWEHVLFTDEAQVELHGTTGRVSVWRRAHEEFSSKCTLPTFKSGRQSVMVWGSICGNGVGTLHICKESVNGAYYRELLKQEVPITKMLNDLPDSTLFVHDNAPAHSAKATQQCLADLNLKSIQHPPQSPDLNPIENIWAILKWELNKSPASSLDDLKKKLPIIWSKISDSSVKKVVRSMPARLDAVRHSLGGHTKY